MPRSAGGLWALHDLLQPVRSLANGIWDLIMEALAEDHDGSVQMIDTSIVRFHQHDRRYDADWIREFAGEYGRRVATRHDKLATNLPCLYQARSHSDLATRL